MQAYIEILNTGGGDIRIEFQEQEGEEGADAGTLTMSEEKAVKLLTDLQKRGYAILVQMPDGTYARAISIDPETATYRVAVPEPKRPGRKPKVEQLPVTKTKTTAVARSAGG